MLFQWWVADLIAGVLALAAAAFIAYYIYATSTYKTWKKKGVPYIEPRFPFGNLNKMLTGKATMAQVFEELYAEFKDNGFGGIYSGREPVLFVCNPELSKYFLTKDFNSFHDRGLPSDEKNDPFTANLVNLSGHRWKVLRAKLSPTFTSGRIKAMFPLIQKCADEMTDYIREEIKKDESIEMKDLLIRFTTDVIGSCAFGIDCNSIKNPHADFHVMSREIFAASRNFSRLDQILLSILLQILPFLKRFYTTRRVFSKITTFFTELIDRTVKYRKANQVERNDFVQLMMKIMEEDKDDIKFDQEMMTTQAFVFFLAGLDNVALTIGFSLHSLAVDPDLQDRVFNEISTVLEEFDGKMCYEALGKMDLVTRVLDETMRMYTPAGALVRKLTEDKYVVPGTSIEINKGTMVMVPTQAIHMDEKYFPNPTKFDPERFTEEEKSKRHPNSYMPFGDGPRFCIASRFAQLEMRLCLAELIRNFNFSAGPKTDILMELDPKALAPAPKNSFWVRAAPREH